MKIKIKANFGYWDRLDNTKVEQIIKNAVEATGFEIHKFRTTYFEGVFKGEFFMAKMPERLMLALLMSDNGLGWYLPKLSGEYSVKLDQ